MSSRVLLMLPALSAACATQALAQNATKPSNNQAIPTIQAAALRAVNFSQGDAEALKRARLGFTPDGWADYMKQMRGFLDEKGAPTFGSSFASSGDAVIISQDQSALHLKVPGTLVQTNGKSRTTYNHAALDVVASGTPLKIKHLECVFVVRSH